MSSLSWNCRGLGNPRAILILKDIVQFKKPRIIFLIETLSKLDKIERIKNQLGYEGSHVVECEGHSGGLALLWKCMNYVKILGFSSNFIDSEVCLNDLGTWRFTGFYGEPTRS